MHMLEPSTKIENQIPSSALGMITSPKHSSQHSTEESMHFPNRDVTTVHSYSLFSASKESQKRRLEDVESSPEVNVNNSNKESKSMHVSKRQKTESIGENKHLLLLYKNNCLSSGKKKYLKCLSELFFLQSGGNFLEYDSFMKTPSSALLSFLQNSLLDQNDSLDIFENSDKSVESSNDHKGICQDTSKGSSSDTGNNFQTPVQSRSQPSISAVFDSSIGSQEEIVERAKQEAYVMQRISELRREGLWSPKRLPKVQEAPRSKTHWDYLLEEMKWLATDFSQEQKWKKNAAKKCSRMILKYFQDKELKEERDKKEEQLRIRRIASSIAKEIKGFWANIEKLVEYKQQTWLDEKRKKALDSHLNYIVDQTEKFSSWITQDLNKSECSDNRSKRGLSSPDTDDRSESSGKRIKYASSLSDSIDSSEKCDEVLDKEFLANFEEEEDDETTMVEEETLQKDEDHKAEINELIEAQNIPLDELLNRYQSQDYSDNSSIESDIEDETSASEDSEMEIDQESNDVPDSFDQSGKEITDIAATAESFQPKGNTLSTTKVVTQVPFLLKHTLREYQHIGLDWLVAMQCKKLNGILADEMGLGKTIQTIALLSHLACDTGVWGPHLVVVPTSVMLNWEMEIKKWCPAFKIITYFGNPKERKLKRQGWTKFNAFHICITSYKLVIQDHQSFRRMKWKYFILDEAQHIKNFKSQRWQMLLNFQSSHRLLLTGTPLQNDLMELWSLMHFLMPNVFQSHREFRDWFANPFAGMIEGSHEHNENLIKRFHKVLRPFLLRRLKSEVEKQLPKKYEHVIMCRLSKRQRFLYDDFMSQSKTKETLASGSFMSVINVLMQLRKVCNHPNLFETRPIISPFMMEGLVYECPTQVWDILSYDPLKDLNFKALNFLFINFEIHLSAFAAHSIQKLKAPQRLIEDITPPPPPPPPCPVGKVKLQVRTSSSSEKASTPVSTPPQKLVMVSHSSHPVTPTPKSEYSIVLQPPVVGAKPRLVTPNSGKPGIPNNPNGRPVSVTPGLALSHLSSSSPITVQISGSKLSVPLGFGRIVNTANGQHILITPLNSEANTQSTPTLSKSLPSSTITQLTSSISSPSKPLTKTSLDSLKDSDLIIPHISQKRIELKRQRHQLLARVNQTRCSAYPTYGFDLVKAVTISSECKATNQPFLNGFGLFNCIKASQTKTSYLTSTTYLKNIVHLTPESYLKELEPIISRFVFTVPPVTAPTIKIHTAHQPLSESNTKKFEESQLHQMLKKGSSFLHSVLANTNTQFPDTRLIQYDCGKLQTLDKLLWDLKMGTHRVLIFTQMSRMLDIMEQFLNYHGHTYLRLDGSTKVDQRQAMMERFNADKRIFCFILSTRSGGIGVNLTGADTVIFYDSDWNPTMDAQAQDRCHRIGQTRDVHIYRLVSEKTVEENILKKANQKRMLGDLAIEGGNFTTAHLKKDTIRDLFDVEAKEDRQNKMDVESQETNNEKISQAQFEQALGMAEEDQDLQAADTAKAEAAAELAEFDESIPIELGDQKETEEKTQVEEELEKLEDQLAPVEKYALKFIEAMKEPFQKEQLKQAVEEIEAQKKVWELDRLKARQEEEERRAQAVLLHEDPLLTMTRESVSQEYVYKDEIMPMWTPPTPPQEENDYYLDDSLNMLYEYAPIPEAQLPAFSIRKESKKHKATSVVVNRKQKVRKEETTPIPRSLFDRPSPAILKLRKEVKMQKVKGIIYSKSSIKPNTVVVKAPSEIEQDKTEWFIQDDLMLLQSIRATQGLPTNLVVVSPGHLPNWDLASDHLNLLSNYLRNWRGCKNRYENVIVPREEGKIMYDTNPKKPKKNKGIYKTKNSRPMTTQELYAQDNNQTAELRWAQRFQKLKRLSGKRKLALPRWQNSSKANFSIVSDPKYNIDPNLTPIQIANLRADRIVREKQKASLQQQAPKVNTTITPNIVSSPTTNIQQQQQDPTRKPPQIPAARITTGNQGRITLAMTEDLTQFIKRQHFAPGQILTQGSPTLVKSTASVSNTQPVTIPVTTVNLNIAKSVANATTVSTAGVSQKTTQHNIAQQIRQYQLQQQLLQRKNAAALGKVNLVGGQIGSMQLVQQPPQNKIVQQLIKQVAPLQVTSSDITSARIVPVPTQNANLKQIQVVTSALSSSSAPLSNLHGELQDHEKKGQPNMLKIRNPPKN